MLLCRDSCPKRFRLVELLHPTISSSSSIIAAWSLSSRSDPSPRTAPSSPPPCEHSIHLHLHQAALPPPHRWWQYEKMVALHPPCIGEVEVELRLLTTSDQSASSMHRPTGELKLRLFPLPQAIALPPPPLNSCSPTSPPWSWRWVTWAGEVVVFTEARHRVLTTSGLSPLTVVAVWVSFWDDSNGGESAILGGARRQCFIVRIPVATTLEEELGSDTPHGGLSGGAPVCCRREKGEERSIENGRKRIRPWLTDGP